MRDSKNILHAKLGVTPMERQYGGGLDAAYMNRRRSSAFADPNATSAFASPMSMGGLPTVYRQDPGQVGDGMDDDYTEGELSNIGGSEISIEDVSFEDPYDNYDNFPTYGTIDPEDPSNESKDRGPQEGDPGFNQMSGLTADQIMRNYDRSKDGFREEFNPLLSNYTPEQLAKAFAVPGAVANMLQALEQGKMVGGGLPGTLQDAINRASNIQFGPAMLGAANRDKSEKSGSGEKSFSSMLNVAKNFVASTKDFSPENMEQFQKDLAKQGARFEPNNAFASVAVGLATPLLASMGSKAILDTPRTVGRIVNRDGLSFELGVNSKGEPSLQVDTGPGSPGALQERDPIGYNDTEPKETPETEMAAGVAAQVKKKSTLEKALAKKKKKRIDPNIQIIMDIYGLTFEEANRFLGNEGVGTGGVDEFEGT